MEIDYDPLAGVRKIMTDISGSAALARVAMKSFEASNAALVSAVSESIRTSLAFQPIVQESISKMLLAFQEQQKETNRILANASSQLMREYNERMKELSTQILKIPKLENPVPVAVYPELTQLLATISEDVAHEVESEINVSTMATVISTDKAGITLSWNQLLHFLYALFMLLYPIYSDLQSDKQAERFHYEKMAQDERHHIERMAQAEQHKIEYLEQDERQHQELMGAIVGDRNKGEAALADFMSFLIPHFPSVEESDDEVHQDR